MHLGSKTPPPGGPLVSISHVYWFSSVLTCGTFDVPLKFAPSVNTNSLVLIPLEAHEWNIPN